MTSESKQVLFMYAQEIENCDDYNLLFDDDEIFSEFAFGKILMLDMADEDCMESIYFEMSEYGYSCEFIEDIKRAYNNGYVAILIADYGCTCAEWNS